MNFERGKDPKEAMGISKKYANIPVKTGDTIFVEFLLRKSCPEYYPLQRQNWVIARAVRDESIDYADTINNECGRSVKCFIKGVSGYFMAFWHPTNDDKKTRWIIDD
jgi:hypothetical protein